MAASFAQFPANFKFLEPWVQVQLIIVRFHRSGKSPFQGELLSSIRLHQEDNGKASFSYHILNFYIFILLQSL